MSPTNPAFCGTAAVGRSLVMGDLDADGAPDLVVGNIASPLRVLRNVVGPRGHWLAVRLVDPARGRRDAVGAEVVVVAGGQRRWAVLQPATSYLAHHEPVLHFGLGPSRDYEALEVRWPDGQRSTHPGGTANRRIVLEAPAGANSP